MKRERRRGVKEGEKCRRERGRHKDGGGRLNSE